MFKTGIFLYYAVLSVISLFNVPSNVAANPAAADVTAATVAAPVSCCRLRALSASVCFYQQRVAAVGPAAKSIFRRPAFDEFNGLCVIHSDGGDDSRSYESSQSDESRDVISRDVPWKRFGGKYFPKFVKKSDEYHLPMYVEAWGK
ncbi:hypothetical protein HELRODRAFT_175419 [Helobdella robusta]|uniref:Uncharacterized protein n=1 Tax=Helobdella robusta TaxID=6412 RepID=T1F989_HELRO|nr:hypothetical protein HELRODRAFT_175419 [Helobdella robusta]ESO00924.1 hypothetical protein HELRODRAFT_175419 [Helobdella robusta]